MPKKRRALPHVLKTRFNVLVPVDQPLRDYCKKWSDRPNPEAHIRVTEEERKLLEQCRKTT